MKKCAVCGRECKQLKKGMCRKHYEQFKKYGKVLDNNPRTYRDPNEIIEYEDHAEVILYNKQCEEISRAIIDLEDVDKVKQYKWSMHNIGYVCSRSNNLLLHRLITNCDDNMVIDHINHNKLDNRKFNLRVCTQQQNMMNQSIRNTNKSGCSGVYFDKICKKWIAQITIYRKTKHLGRFNTKEEAIKKRKQAEIDLFGEYRNKDDEGVI